MTEPIRYARTLEIRDETNLEAVVKFVEENIDRLKELGLSDGVVTLEIGFRPSSPQSSWNAAVKVVQDFIRGSKNE